MIGFLNGNVISYNENNIILDVNGVGFEIMCSASATEYLINAKKGGIFTYLNVREDGMFLYGFISKEEKNMFLKLISVSGIGTKMGITILSSMPLNDLAFIIASQDSKSLSKVKGLGKKTAERIILELRENISSLDLPEGKKPTPKTAVAEPSIYDDAVIALMSLGFSRVDSEKAVSYAKDKGLDTIESVIKVALQSVK